MKKHYKTKPINITKLKTYLKDAIKTDNKGNRRSDRSKQCNTKRNDLHQLRSSFKDTLVSSLNSLHSRQVVVS